MGLDVARALSRTGDGMVAVDRVHRIVGWNQAAARLLGYAEAEVKHRACCTVFAWSDRHGNAVCGPGCVAEAIREPEVVENQQVLGTRSDGSRIWLEVTTVVLPRDLREQAVLVHFFREAALPAALARIAEGAARAGRRPAGPDVHGLTARERQVIDLVAEGASTQAIATRLGISSATVRNHIQHVLDKLEVPTRAAAVARLSGG